MKLPVSAYNKITIFGAIIAVATLFLIIFLFVASTFIVHGSPYLGIFDLMILPGVLILGLLLIPVGMFFKNRELKLHKEDLPHDRLVVDLNNPRHRNAVIIFVVGTIIFFILSGVGSY